MRQSVSDREEIAMGIKEFNEFGIYGEALDNYHLDFEIYNRKNLFKMEDFIKDFLQKNMPDCQFCPRHNIALRSYFNGCFKLLNFRIFLFDYRFFSNVRNFSMLYHDA